MKNKNCLIKNNLNFKRIINWQIINKVKIYINKKYFNL